MTITQNLSGIVSALESGVRLRALAMIRWAAVAGQLFTVVVVHWGMDYPLPIAAAFTVIGISALLNIVVSLRLPSTARLEDRQAAVFLGFDIVQLTALLYLTGGLHNPFALLLLAPVAVAASILTLGSTIAVCLLAIGCISVIGVWRRPLPWSGPEPELPLMLSVALWTALVLTTLLIAIYAWRVAEEARRMSRALAATSAALAREQQVSALGALAAAAAHELGSPLGTITLVSKELVREVPRDSPLADDITLLASQAERCREILARLTRRPEGDTSDAYQLVPLPALVEAAAAPYLDTAKRVEFQFGPADRHANAPAPMFQRSPELLHGLGNIVQNACEFAAGEIRVRTEWGRDGAEVEVTDDGPGFPTELLSELGEPYISTRTSDRSHLGLGVFIAKTLLQRTGAEVTFANRKKGGARVMVSWPKATYKMADNEGDRA